MTRKGRRMALIAAALAVIGAAAGLTLYALSDNIVFFYSPSELAAKNVALGTRLRIGGIVEPGSVVKSANEQHRFLDLRRRQEREGHISGPAAGPFPRGAGRRRRGTLTAPDVMTRGDDSGQAR